MERMKMSPVMFVVGVLLGRLIIIIIKNFANRYKKIRTCLQPITFIMILFIGYLILVILNIVCTKKASRRIIFWTIEKNWSLWNANASYYIGWPGLLNWLGIGSSSQHARISSFFQIFIFTLFGIDKQDNTTLRRPI